MGTIFTATDGARGQELWISHGTAATTFLLKDIRSGASGSNPLILGYLAVAGMRDTGRVLFLANDGTAGDELWVTDGTTAGTVRFKDINPGAAGSFASDWTTLGPRAVFAATDAINGRELWVSDGTEAGTVLLQNLNAGTADANPVFLGYMPNNGTLDTTRGLFLLDNGTNGREIWVTNGTSAGTAILKDINPGAASANPTTLTMVNGHAVFTANDGSHGTELWVTDGTAVTTTLLVDAALGAAGSDPDLLGFLIVAGAPTTDRMLFALDNISNGRELWVTNGTAAGTVLFKDINPGSGGSDPSAWTAVNGRAVFVADNGSNGAELWVSDGTAPGTVLLKDARAGALGSSPELVGYLLVNGVASTNTLLFIVDDGVNGAELWRTDGTAAGTVLFKDINPGAGGAQATSWTAVNGRAVFVADDGAHGRELWVSDGTALGTTLLKDVRVGADSANPTLLGYLTTNGIANPNRLLFLMEDGATGQEIWVTDGTEAGTVLFTDINTGAGGSFASAGVEIAGTTIDLSGATLGITLDLGAAGAPNNATGTGFNDIISGNAAPNQLAGGVGDDTLRGLGGNDVLDGGPGNDTLNGGGGSNSATFSGIRGASEIRFNEVNFDVIVVGPDGIDTTTNIQSLVFSDRTTQVLGPTGVQHLVNVSFPQTATNRFMIGDAYTGPVAGLSDEFVFPTPQNINIASSLPNSFIRTGAGDDAITVASGRNVVDASTGSNFLTGGTGKDTFFVDARGGGVTWDTIVGFQVGDEVTLFGYQPGVSIDGEKNAWRDSDGTGGFTGLTVHAKLDGTTISGSITFAGLTPADKDSFVVTTGVVGGDPYLYITRI